jgi:hypothetical protein
VGMSSHSKDVRCIQSVLAAEVLAVAAIAGPGDDPLVGIAAASRISAPVTTRGNATHTTNGCAIELT